MAVLVALPFLAACASRHSAVATTVPAPDEQAGTIRRVEHSASRSSLTATQAVGQTFTEDQDEFDLDLKLRSAPRSWTFTLSGAASA